MRFAGQQFVIGGKRLAAPSLHDALWWALAAAIALLGAILLWTLVTPVSPLGSWRPAQVRVLDPTARSALFAAVDPFNRTPATAVTQAGPGAVTGLALTLYGIRVNAATGGGSAIIAGADGLQQVYRVGIEVMPGVTLSGVHFDHVVLANNGASELLYLDQSKPAANAASVLAQTPAGPVAQTAPATPPGEALSVSAVRENISFVPRSENGRVTGLAVSSGPNAAPFRAAGFQPGDVISAIGGKAVTSANDVPALLRTIQPGQSVTVTVNRNGQQLPLAIAVDR